MRISDSFELLLLAALWGASFLFVRIAAPILGPVLLIELRLLIAGLTLLLFLIRLNLLEEIRQKLVPLFVIGCINLAFPYLLFAIAALYLPAGFASILNATAPLFGIVITGFWLREKLTVSQFMGLVIGFAGVTILVGWTSIPVTLSFAGSVAVGLLGSCFYAISAAYAKQKLVDVSPLAAATGSLLASTVVLLPITPFFLPPAFPSLKVILVVLALSLFSTAFAAILYFRLISNIGASKSLTVGYLIPLFAMLWGALVLEEPITKSMIVGCILILSGTAIAVSQ